MKSSLPLHIESAPRLADFLQVNDVLLVREDQLPDGGGKKRRSLDSWISSLHPLPKSIHVLSYEGSHTAYTLAQLLSTVKIVLYGMSYSGGWYRKHMREVLNTYPNLRQIRAPLPILVLRFLIKKWFLGHSPDHRFMSWGGALRDDQGYHQAARDLQERIGSDDYYHLLPVASGDMLNAVSEVFPNVAGILTQPFLIRWIQRLRLSSTQGFFLPSIKKRERLVQTIYRETGYAFDPVFMGPVFSAVLHDPDRYQRVCIWVTCPVEIQSIPRLLISK